MLCTSIWIIIPDTRVPRDLAAVQEGRSASWDALLYVGLLLAHDPIAIQSATWYAGVDCDEVVFLTNGISIFSS